MTLYILGAIIISIVLGYKTKINIGFFAIVFSYLIGCFGMGLKASEVIALWPIKIFFIILAVTLFYNFSLANGALEKLSGQLLYYRWRFLWSRPSFQVWAQAITQCWPLWRQ